MGSKCKWSSNCRNYQPLPNDECIENPKFNGSGIPAIKIKIDFDNAKLTSSEKENITKDVNDSIAKQLYFELNGKLNARVNTNFPKCFDQKTQKSLHKDAALTQERSFKRRKGYITKFFNGKYFITTAVFNEPANRFEWEQNIISKQSVKEEEGK